MGPKLQLDGESYDPDQLSESSKALLELFMGAKLQLDGESYDPDQLSESGKDLLELLKFTSERELEVSNTLKVMIRAKNSYISRLKKEIISKKAGLLLDDS